MAKTSKNTNESEDSKKKSTKSVSKNDSLLANLAAELNKNNKEGGKIAYFLDEQDDPSTISDWISTGSSLLDLAISNRPNGGLPVGRMVEFNGLEGTGKSLVSAHIVANTQKKGGKAIFIDTENAAAPDFWKSLGVDLSNLLYIQRETVEDIFTTMEQAIAYIRKDQPDALLTIIVDSVAAASTKAEMESDHGKDGYATGKAIIISKALRKITSMIGRQKVLIVFTNQLRQNLNASPFGDQYTVSGGKGLPYHCSVRVRLNNAGQLKLPDKTVIGNECKAVVVKNRMGPPQRHVFFNIYFDSGIADYASWLEVLKEKAYVKPAGSAGLKYVALNGDEVVFKSESFIKLLDERPEFKTEMYNRICDAVIMQYKNANSTIIDSSANADEDAEMIADESDIDHSEENN
jgi:recombination protein RecA